jgi:hypothetical protein
MTTYGVVPEGFSRKPLATILAEIEAAMVTEFGPQVIQTSQSPFGQINGLMADLISQLWEFGEDVYQSYDIDQAEGTRLDGLATLRIMERSQNESDEDFRLAITNQGRARVDIADLDRALRAIDGVTYVQVWIPGNADTDEQEVPPGYVCVAILGGDPAEIATVMRLYIVPGISTYGNESISATIEGYCRTMRILRPILVPVELTVDVRVGRDPMGCPPPSLLAIRDTLYTGLLDTLRNGDDITYYSIRKIIESAFANVEVISFNGKRDNEWLGHNTPVVIGFVEMATVANDRITVTIADANQPIPVGTEINPT